jgi:hypothetical protein
MLTQSPDLMHERYGCNTHHDDTVPAKSQGLVCARRSAGRKRRGIWRIESGFLAAEAGVVKSPRPT